MTLERLIATEAVTLMDGREAIPVDALRAAAEEMVQAYIDAEAGNEFNARMEAAHTALRAALASSRPEPLDVEAIAERVRGASQHTEDDYRRGYDRAIDLMVRFAREYDRLGDKG